jgi:predicted metal-dependent hydrolase
MTPPRLTDRLLPPYSYVSGKFPHPESDPAGHSFGMQHEACEDDFAYGVDLFNHGYYWEAHEAWERLWHAAGRSGNEADHLKGLIKLAAAGVKAREGNVDGVRRHARRAGELFRASQKKAESLCRFAAEIERDAEQLINTADDPVVCVFGILPETSAY